MAQQLFSSEKIRLYIVSLRQNGNSESTIKRKVSSVSKFAQWALDKGKITSEQYKQFEAEFAKLRNELNVHSNQVKLKKVETLLSKAKNVGQSMDPRKYYLLTRRHFIGLFAATALIFAFGIGLYNQFFQRAKINLAYPSTPTRAGRILNFQGFLTDSSTTPITTAINMRFRLYDDPSAGTTLYDSSTCSINPDINGVVNVMVGTNTPSGQSCGAEIDPDTFTRYTNVYLGVTVGADAEMTPRQQVANVGYAINSETLQGLPPGTDKSTIAYINQLGNLLIATSTPGIRSTLASETFQVSSANALTLISAGSGDITLNATESGAIKLITNNTSGNQIQATNANLVSGSLLYGYVGNGGTGYNLLQLQSGASPTDRFVVDALGNTNNAGTLTVGGSITQNFTGTNTTAFTQNVNSLTSGNGHTISSVQGSSSNLFTGVLQNTTYSKTYTGTSGIENGNLLNASRNININSLGNTLTVSGSLAALNDSASVTQGALTHSADVLDITQGYTSNTGSALNVTTAGTGYALRVNDDGTLTDTTPFVINAAGNVGIGLTNPQYLLDVSGGAGIVAQFSGRVIGASAVNANEFTTLSQLSASTFWQRNLGVLAPSNITDDLLIGRVATPSASTHDYFQVLGTGATAGDASSSGTLTLGTNRSSGLIHTERMLPLVLGNATTGSVQLSPKGTNGVYVDGTGNTGIGTTYAGYQLSVANTIGLTNNTMNMIRSVNSNDSGYQGFQIQALWSAFTAGNVGIGTTTIGSALQVNGSTALGYSAATTGPTNGLAVSGNVGIGTTSPTYPLHVNSTTTPQIGITNGANTATISQGATGLLGIVPTNGIYLFADPGQASTSILAGARTVNSAASAYGYNIDLHKTGSGGAGGILSFVYSDANSGTNTVEGGYLYTSITGAYSAGNENGLRTIISNNASATISSDVSGVQSRLHGAIGTVSGKTSFFYARNTISSGTMPALYGLYVESLTQGTSNYSIFTAGTTPSYFGGNVGIGTSTPAYLLDVSGGTGIVGQFSGRVIGADAVNGNEFLTLNQLTAATYWQRNLGVLAPKNITDDLLIGRVATPSASTHDYFQVIGTGATAGDASSSGILTLGTNRSSGLIHTERMLPLILGNATTGSVQLSPKGTTGLFVDGTGNVGVGTSNINNGYNLDVTGGIRASSTVFADGGAYASFNAAGTYIGNTSIGAGGAVGYTGSSTTALWAGSGMPLVMGTNGSEYVRIDSIGNVGIGITNPTSKLHVYNSDTSNTTTNDLIVEHIGGGGGGQGTGILLKAGGVDFAQIQTVNDGAASGSLRFSNRTPGGLTETLRISNVGNVGVGTTNPTSKLHVAGDLKVDSYATVSAGLAVGYPSVAPGGGNGVFSGRIGIGTTTPAYLLDVSGGAGIVGQFSGRVIGADAVNGNEFLTLNQLTAATYWQRNLGVLAPKNITDDLLIGRVATPSASTDDYFQITGTGANEGNASSSGILTLGTNRASGVIGTARMLPLVLGSATTGSVQLSPKGTTGLFVAGSGNVGVGTNNPDGSLVVYGGVSNVKTKISDTAISFSRSADGAYTSSITNAGAATTSLTYTAYDNHVFTNISGTQGLAVWRDSAAGNINRVRVGQTLPSATSSIFSVNGNGAIGASYINANAPANGLIVEGNVGIGITAPLGKLDVLAGAARTGTHATTPSFYVTATMGTGQTGPASGNIEFRHDNATQGIGFGYNTIYQAGTNTNQDLNLISKGSSPLTLNAYPYSTGNVGIGITNPSSKLQINGNAAIGYGTTATVGPANGLAVSGNVGIGTTAPTARLHLTVPNSNDSSMTFSQTGAQNWTMGNPAATLRFDISLGVDLTAAKLSIANSGNVGIGTTNPIAKLQIAGDLKVDTYATISASLSVGGYNAPAGPGNAVFNGKISVGSATLDTARVAIADASNALRLEAGNTSAVSTANQLILSYGGGTSYSHAIKTRHNSGTAPGNDIDFYLWNQGVDAAGTIGTKHVMTLEGSGNVGIGNTTPGALLDVAGNIRSTTGSLQIGNAANVAYNRFGTAATAHSLNDSTDVLIQGDLEVQGTLYGNINPSFTPGSIIYAGATGALTQDNANFFYNYGSGFVGLGTTTVGSRLQVNGATALGYSASTAGPANGLAVSGNVGIGTTAPGYALDVNNSNVRFGDGGTNTDIRMNATGYGRFIVGANEIMRLQIGGNVGIGATNATQRLTVTGGNIQMTDSAAKLYLTDGNHYLSFDGTNSVSYFNGGNYYFNNGSTNVLAVTSGGNVGIGMTNPAYKLEISGGIARQSGYNVADAATNNLLVNGDFEMNGVYGWSGLDSAVSGGYSGNYAGQRAGSATVLSDDYIPVDPTRDALQLEGYFKKSVAGTTPGTIYFGYIAYDASKVAITTAPCGTYCYFASSGYAFPDSNWHKFSATTTGEGTSWPNFPVGTKFVRVLVLISYGGSVDTVTQMDHVTLKRINHGSLFVGNNFNATNMTDQYQLTQLYTTAANNFIVTSPGNVGIGTTNPGSYFDVAGNMRTTTGTLQIGNASNVAYNRFGTTATAQGLDASNDLLISDDLEVQGTIYGTVVGVPNPGFTPGSVVYTGPTGALAQDNANFFYNTSTSQLGLGTTTPGSRLQVYGATALGYSASTAGPSNGLAVSGNVGIGLTNPSYKLEVNGQAKLSTTGGATSITDAVTAAALRLDYNNNPGYGTYFGSIQSGGGVNQYIQAGLYSPATAYNLMLNPYGGTVGIGVTAAGSNLQVSGSTALGYSASTAGPANGLAVSGNVGIGTTTAGSNLQVNGTSALGYSAATTGPTNGLAVSGNVGIGITSAAEKMEISTGVSNVATLITDRSILFRRSLDGVYSSQGLVHDPSTRELRLLSNGGGGYLTFFDGVGTEAMRITGGNVGIGTTNPTAKLHIAGNLRVDTYATISASLSVGTFNAPAGPGNAVFSGLVGIGTSAPSSRLHIVGNTVGNILTINDGSSDLVTISSAQSTFNNPTSFTSSGDVSIAYDINFTNPTSSFIKSSAPLTVASGETFNSSDLTLKSYMNGDIVMDAGTSGSSGTIAFYDAYVKAATINTPIEFASGSGEINTFRTTYGSTATLIGAIGSLASGGSGAWIYSGASNYYLYPSDYLNAKVGIGNSNPVNRLSVTGSASIGSSSYNVAAPTNGLIVEGNVGIGTTNTTVGKLRVAGGDIIIDAASGLDVATAGVINIGNTTATTLNLGTTAATTLNFGAGGALTRTINIGTGTGVDTIHIGDGGTGADIITIGSANAGNVTVQSNATLNLTGSTNSIINFPNFDVATSGNVTVAAGQGIDTNAAGILNIGNTTATTLNLGTTAATTLNFGAGGALTRTINIGTGTGVDTIHIGDGGTGADIITIGSANAGSVTIDTATGASAIQIGNSTGAHGILIGSSATGDQDVSIGSANANSSLTLEAGTNTSAIQIGNGATAHGIRIGANASGDQDILLGSNNAGSTMNIEAGTGASSLLIGNSTTAHNILIGNGGTSAQVVTIGSQSTTSSLTLNSGTPAMTFNNLSTGASNAGYIFNANSMATGTGTTAGFVLNANALTSGGGMYIGSTATAYTGAGPLFSISKTGASGSTSMTGSVANIAYSQTYTSGTITQNGTAGNTLNVSRSLTNSGATVSVSSPVMYIGDAGSGTITHTADVLRIGQTFGSNTGATLNLTTAATSSSAYALRVNDDGNFNDSSAFVIDSTGNVGIGNTTPVVKLDIYGNVRTSGVFMSAGNTAGQTFNQFGSGPINSGVSGVISTNSDLYMNGDIGIEGRYYGYANTVNYLEPDNPTLALSLGGPAGINMSSNNMHTDAILTVRTQNTGGVVIGTSTNGYSTSAGPINGLAIEGNVGILTASPSAPLAVTGVSRVGALTLTAGTGGSMAAGDYYYTVTAVGAAGETTGTETLRTGVGATGTVTVSWTAVTGAAYYNVYRTSVSGNYSPANGGLVGTPTNCYRVRGTTCLDTLATGSLTAKTPPTNGQGSATMVAVDTLGNMKTTGVLALAGMTNASASAAQIIGYNGENWTTVEIIGASGSRTNTSLCVSWMGQGGTTCDGKIDAGTVDPPYTINGEKYATYMASMTGVKEETTGNIELNTYVPGVGYSATINFNTSPKGSDAWLFAQTTNLLENMDQMVTLATPSNNARIWYSTDKGAQTLTFYGSRKTTVSYRLTAPRFDYQDWANTRPESSRATGFILNTPQGLNLTSTGDIMEVGVEIRQIGSTYDLVDAAGNALNELASYTQATIARIEAGIVTTQKLIVEQTATFLSDVNVSGTINAKNVYADNILALADTVEEQKTLTANLASQVNNLQSQMSSILSQDIASGKYYMSVEGITTVNLTVADTATMAKLIATSAQIGSIQVDNNTISTTLADLRFDALEKVTFFDNSVIIAKDGSVTTKGVVIAQGGVKTDSITTTKPGNDLVVTLSKDQSATASGQTNSEEPKLKIQNVDGSDVASINASGSAYFADGVTFNKNIASASAVMDANTAWQQYGVATPAIKTNGESSGQAVIPAGTTELTILNTKVKDNSLLYVTPLSSTSNQTIYVEAKQEGAWFKIKIDQPISTDITFNWWIL